MLTKRTVLAASGLAAAAIGFALAAQTARAADAIAPRGA